MISEIGAFLKSTWGSLGHIAQWLTLNQKTVAYRNSHFDRHCQNPITVVLIHGTADRACAGTRLARGILKDAPPHVRGCILLAFNDRARGRGIVDYSEQLRDFLKTLPKNEGVVLIGHSRGGLVAAHAAQKNLHEGCLPSILACISICSPFQGSWLAGNWAGLFSKSIVDMRPNSSFLNMLHQDMINQPACSYHFIYGTQDYIVSTPGIVPEIVNEKSHSSHELTGESHLSITGAPECHKIINEILNLEDIKNRHSMPTPMK